MRGNLQECGAQNAYRTLEAEYVKHVLYGVANSIVEKVLRYDCDGIVFEQLDGIHERIPETAWHSEWAFDRLYEYVEYKAEGLFVETTNPNNTSERCAKYGFVYDDNRPFSDTFGCNG